MASTKNKVHKAFGIDVASHGDLTGTSFDPNVNLEVIGIGLSRTGTTSLQAALTKLGYGPSHQGVDLFRSVKRTEAFIDIYHKVLAGVWTAKDPVLIARFRELMRGYKSSTDIPINSFVEEIYAAYPNAKYVLTVRPDGAAGWWKSLQPTAWHYRRDGWRYLFRFLIWPVSFLRKTDDKVQLIHALWKKKYGPLSPQIYDIHNAFVRKTIPPEQLLVWDVRDGWKPLCDFLQVPVPQEPFPNLNESGAMRIIYTGMMLYGAFTWTAYLSLGFGLGYLAWHPDLVKLAAGRIEEFCRGILK